MIIGRYDAILKQSEHEYLYNQWSNDTNIWISWSSIKFSKPSPWAEVKIKLRRRKIKACKGAEPLTAMILLQCSSNWANINQLVNKPTHV